jgi:hypothetical protein
MVLNVIIRESKEEGTSGWFAEGNPIVPQKPINPHLIYEQRSLFWVESGSGHSNLPALFVNYPKFRLCTSTICPKTSKY